MIMKMPYSRICPFCNITSTITNNDIEKYENFIYQDKSDDNYYLWKIYAVTCPSEKCRKVEVYIEKNLNITLAESKQPYVRSIANRSPNYEYKPLKTYSIEPEANVKVFPDYIPKIILQDYKEAKLILNLSPRASATLSRRCLQAMIRDFWGVKDKKTLHAEIKEIESQINTDMYNAIMALKSIGNIGAHSENDINIIVDIEPDEADQLVGLIEILIEDWYISRHERENRLNKIHEINTRKQLERNTNS